MYQTNTSMLTKHISPLHQCAKFGWLLSSRHSTNKKACLLLGLSTYPFYKGPVIAHSRPAIRFQPELATRSQWLILHYKYSYTKYTDEICHCWTREPAFTGLRTSMNFWIGGREDCMSFGPLGFGNFLSFFRLLYAQLL